MSNNKQSSVYAYCNGCNAYICDERVTFEKTCDHCNTLIEYHAAEKQNENKTMNLEDKNMALHIDDVVSRFSESQTLSMIGTLRNLGVGLKILKNNKWETLHEYKLPFERFIPLYNDDFKICDIGVY